MNNIAVCAHMALFVKLNWDTPLPPEMQNKWIQFYASLKALEQLIIPRHVPFSNSDSFQMHGFCDASQHAYGACIYILSTTTGLSQLYCSKSRVAPHFGGLWEAAVKSTKRHLLKVNSMGLLTFEEMSTLLCRIEAVLNSRPIAPMSDSPSDFTPLTPAHFLVGGALTLPAEPDSTEVPLNRVRRWELVKVQAQFFWKRWSSEYLPQLHKRGRWLTNAENIQIGSLAILKEDNLPSLQWKMVRVTKVHPGSDGIIRVITVINSAGREFQRSATKIAVLPTIKEEEDTA